MRKEIIRRRLKAEVASRKKIGTGSAGAAFTTINQSVNNSIRKSLNSNISERSLDGN